MTVRELSGTTAIVTGASRGFGRATAIALAGRGAHVVGVARSEPRLEQLRQELGDRFDFEVANVADPSLPERLFAQHQPQIVVLNAGATPVVGLALRADLGDLQHQLADGRPPGLQLCEGQPSRPARSGFGGGHHLECRGVAWLAAERRLRRCQGDSEVHQFLRHSRGGIAFARTAVCGHSAHADPGDGPRCGRGGGVCETCWHQPSRHFRTNSLQS